MVLDQYRKVEGFPFPYYYRDVEQYIAAQNYFTALLKEAEGFVDGDWHPVESSMPLSDDMYTGLLLHIYSIEDAKEILLSVSSVEGYGNMLLKENSGMTPHEISGVKELFGPDFYISESLKDGVSSKEAIQEAEEKFLTSPTDVWVENTVLAVDGVTAIERLIVVSNISEQAELKIIDALTTFLEPGPRANEINQRFSDSEDKYDSFEP